MILATMSSARLWPVLLALACAPRTATTEGDSASGSDASTATSSAGPVTDAIGSSGTGAASDAETGCAALCGAYDLCAPELSGPDCIPGCVEGIAPPLPETCAAAWVQFYTCLAALSCEALLGDAPCPAENAAIDASCAESEPCTIETDSTTAKRCSYQETCTDQPTRGLECINATCTCIIDGVDGATCPSDGICTNTGELGSKMLTCCS